MDALSRVVQTYVLDVDRDVALTLVNHFRIAFKGDNERTFEALALTRALELGVRSHVVVVRWRESVRDWHVHTLIAKDSAVLVVCANADESERARKLGATHVVTVQLDEKNFSKPETNVGTLSTGWTVAYDAFRTKIPYIVGDSAPMKTMKHAITAAAEHADDVLILGETGTGKELIARAIHNRSERSKNSFEAINLPDISENLFESELFGHERGAFTDATTQRLGVFERNQGGSVLIDEIGDLPLPLQAKLLRVLQQREVRRLGGQQVIKLNVRMLFATNKELESLVATGRFRQDLFFRVNRHRIAPPALRERGSDDIQALLEHFLCRDTRGLKPRTLAELGQKEVLERLLAHGWPGNVRELENTACDFRGGGNVERLIDLGQDAETRTTTPTILQLKQAYHTFIAEYPELSREAVSRMLLEDDHGKGAFKYVVSGEMDEAHAEAHAGEVFPAAAYAIQVAAGAGPVPEIRAELLEGLDKIAKGETGLGTLEKTRTKLKKRAVGARGKPKENDRFGWVLCHGVITRIESAAKRNDDLKKIAHALRDVVQGIRSPDALSVLIVQPSKGEKK